MNLFGQITYDIADEFVKSVDPRFEMVYSLPNIVLMGNTGKTRYSRHSIATIRFSGLEQIRVTSHVPSTRDDKLQWCFSLSVELNAKQENYVQALRACLHAIIDDYHVAMEQGYWNWTT